MSGQERSELSAIIDLVLADSFIPGWQQMVVLELERMRRILPGATAIELRLVQERRQDDEGHV